MSSSSFEYFLLCSHHCFCHKKKALDGLNKIWLFSLHLLSSGLLDHCTKVYQDLLEDAEGEKAGIFLSSFPSKVLLKISDMQAAYFKAA